MSITFIDIEFHNPPTKDICAKQINLSFIRIASEVTYIKHKMQRFISLASTHSHLLAAKTGQTLPEFLTAFNRRLIFDNMIIPRKEYMISCFRSEGGFFGSVALTQIY